MRITPESNGLERAEGVISDQTVKPLAEDIEIVLQNGRNRLGASR